MARRDAPEPQPPHNAIAIPNGRPGEPVLRRVGDAIYVRYGITFYDCVRGPVVVLQDADPNRSDFLPLRWISAKVATELHRDLGNPDLLVFERTVIAGRESWAALRYRSNEWDEPVCVRVVEGAEQLLRDAIAAPEPRIEDVARGARSIAD